MKTKTPTRSFPQDSNAPTASRRDALKVLGLSAAVALAAGESDAQTADDYKALVCIYLHGGNDPWNTVAPRSGSAYASYQAARPAIAIPANELLAINPVNFSGPQVGLSPHMPGVRTLFEQGKASIVANVGPLVGPTTKADFQAGRNLPTQLFSHADQTKVWQSGFTDAAGGSGWLGRIADLLQSTYNSNSPIPISLALSGNGMTGGAKTLTYAVNTNGATRIGALTQGSAATQAAVRDLLTATRTNLMEKQYTTINSRSIANADVLSGALAAAPQVKTQFPNTDPGRQAGAIARMIAARGGLKQKRQIFYMQQGGYDFHNELPKAQAVNLSELDGAITALYTALVELGVADKVTIFTASEFGRCLRSNGRGSDHGWGSNHFVIGGAVQGKRIFGTFPSYAIDGPEDSGNGATIPTTSVDEYAATFGRWFGVGSSDLSYVAPNLGRMAVPNLGFLL
jgi:uncharacterized protein (DUF1501 family)